MVGGFLNTNHQVCHQEAAVGQMTVSNAFWNASILGEYQTLLYVIKPKLTGLNPRSQLKKLSFFISKYKPLKKQKCLQHINVCHCLYIYMSATYKSHVRLCLCYRVSLYTHDRTFDNLEHLYTFIITSNVVYTEFILKISLYTDDVR